MTWDDALAGDPDVVVCAPCGYDLEGSAALGAGPARLGCAAAGLPVWAVDANASFARPGPRLVDGVENLARILAGRRAGPDGGPSVALTCAKPQPTGWGLSVSPVDRGNL